MLRTVIQIVVLLFPISEIVLAIVKRARGGAARSEDRGSMALLWVAILAGVGLGFAAQWATWARLPGPAVAIRVVALVLLVSGLAIRWTAILTLGRLFTVNVAIHDGHAVVAHGPYRFVRHPSYTGLMVAFLGLGVAFGSWLGIIGLLAPIGLALWYRVSKEESALLASLGPAYAEYCATTKRFVPGVL